MPLHIPQRQQFPSRCPVAIRADASWRVEQHDAEAEILIEASHAIGVVVRQDHGTGMAQEPLGEADLIVPREAVGAVLGEGGVVGRIGVEEIVCVQGQVAEVGGREVPRREHALMTFERVGIVDAAIATEGDIKGTLAIEAAETVEAGAIEVVEQGRRLARAHVAPCDELIEAFAMVVVGRRVVGHFQANLQSALNPIVEVDEVRVRVVQESFTGTQAQGDGQAAAEGLDQAPVPVARIERGELGDEPALTSQPFQERRQRWRCCCGVSLGGLGLWRGSGHLPWVARESRGGNRENFRWNFGTLWYTTVS